MSTYEDAYRRMMARSAPFEDGHGLEFKGAKDSGGYGVVRVGKRLVNAHRLAFGVRTGWWPAQVMHRCDRPACVAEDCLMAGNARLNQLDSVAKGRAHRRPICGSDNVNAKFSPEEVRVLRREHAAGASMSSLARTYGVSRETIRLIVNGRRYASVA